MGIRSNPPVRPRAGRWTAGPGAGRWAAGLTAVVTSAGLLVGAAAGAVTGDPAGDPAYGFVAKVAHGSPGEDGSGCSGALVAPQWVLTAKSCFAAGGAPVVAGPPARPTSVTVGRVGGAAGRTVPVNRLVPHADRDLVLARLAVRVTDVAPVRLGGPAPVAGEELVAAGFGRTAGQWVPDAAHSAAITVTAVTGTRLDVAGVRPAAATTCKGDAGGPAVRETADGPELVAVHHTSWQGGCLGQTETRTAAVETRVDDLADWIRANTPANCNAEGWASPTSQQGVVVYPADFTGDCRTDAVRSTTAGALNGWPSTGDLSADGRLFVGPAVTVGSSWTTSSIPRIVTGDFTGDGRADIIAQLADGTLRAWAGTGDMSTDARLFATTPRSVGSGWTTTSIPQIITGDWNGDGRTDIMAQRSTGVLTAWTSTGDLSADGRLFTNGRTVGNGWTPASYPRIVTGDFTGDGRTDIVRATAAGALQGWASTGDFSADNRLFAGAPATVGSGWTAAGIPRIITGDWNGDGRTDIMAQRSTGVLTAWTSSGNMTDGRLFTNGRDVGSGWTVASYPRIVAGDFNGDGRTDLLNQNTAGQLRGWLSTGDLSADGRLFVGAARVVGNGWTLAAYPRIV